MDNFDGVKIALFFENQLLVYLRDDKPGLRFANMWDFPGGGRENNETPIECAQREVSEEFAINIKPDAIIWKREYPAMHDVNLKAYFLVACITKGDIDKIQLGEEGQKWDLMSIDSFLTRDDVVPGLKGRLKDYLKEKKQ